MQSQVCLLAYTHARVLLTTGSCVVAPPMLELADVRIDDFLGRRLGHMLVSRLERKGVGSLRIQEGVWFSEKFPHTFAQQFLTFHRLAERTTASLQPTVSNLGPPFVIAVESLREIREPLRHWKQQVKRRCIDRRRHLVNCILQTYLSRVACPQFNASPPRHRSGPPFSAVVVRLLLVFHFPRHPPHPKYRPTRSQVTGGLISHCYGLHLFDERPNSYAAYSCCYRHCRCDSAAHELGMCIWALSLGKPMAVCV